MENRKTYLDLIRIIAIFLVIFHHTIGMGLHSISSGFKSWIYAFITIMTTVNVPLFFMVSGSLLLGKVEDYKIVINKRLIRFCLTLVVFSSMYVIWKRILCKDYDITINEFVYKLFSGSIDDLFSYWYLYAYIGFLLTLPFMQRIAKGFSKSDFWVTVIIFSIFFTFIPMLNVLLNRFELGKIVISGDLKIPIATMQAFYYPLLGYYIDNNVNVEILGSKKIGGLISIALVCTLISVCFLKFEENKFGDYLRLFVTVLTIVAFIVVKYFALVICPKISGGGIGLTISRIGSLTFGMYLLDPFFKLLLENKYREIVEPFCYTLVVSYGWCILSMILGGLITYILKKIPVFNKLL